MKEIDLEELERLIQKLESSSSLSEEDENIIKGLIQGQINLIGICIQILKASGNERSKLLKELAKILSVELKKKNSSHNRSKNSKNKNNDDKKDQESNDDSSGEKEQTDENSSEDEPKDDGDRGDKGDKNGKETANSSRRGHDDYDFLCEYDHYHSQLNLGDLCPSCGRGKVYPFRNKVIPIIVGSPPLYYEAHRLHLLRCNACQEIFEPSLPKDIPMVGRAKPTAQLSVILLHYGTGAPFNALSHLQKIYRQNLSPSQLWKCIEPAAELIRKIFDTLVTIGAQAKTFYLDDTPVKILEYYPANRENRQKPRSKRKAPEDRVGMYSSAVTCVLEDGKEVKLFFHGRKYAGENFRDVYDKRIPGLPPPISMSDASTMNFPQNLGLIDCKCNSHAYRKFKEIKNIYPKECSEILKLYKQAFTNDDFCDAQGYSEEERLDYHKKHSLPVMQKMKTVITHMLEKRLVEPNSSLGEAIIYTLKYWDKLIKFCKIAGAPICNNKSERILKYLIRLRKTSSFFKTELGAFLGGMIQSILATARDSGNEAEYLLAILEHPEKVISAPENWLPWNYQTTMKECLRTNGNSSASTQTIEPLEDNAENIPETISQKKQRGLGLLDIFKHPIMTLKGCFAS